MEVHNLDALSWLLARPDNSVDLVITSPPYADARTGSYHGTRPENYVGWFLYIAEEIRRVLRPSGSFILNIKEKAIDGQRHPYVYTLVLAMIDEGWRWTDEYVWHKKTCMPGYWPNRLRDQWERCYQFNKSEKFFMDQKAVMVPIKESTAERAERASRREELRVRLSGTGSGLTRQSKAQLGKSMVSPGNVLHLCSENRNVGHPAAFPKALPEFFIKLFCPDAGIVLDPFAGSGTVGIAARDLGRDAILVELEEKYCQVILRRLNQPRCL